MPDLRCTNRRLPVGTPASFYPSDKSISQRALLMAAQCPGETLITNLNTSTSVTVLVEALRTLGVRITQQGERAVSVSGPIRSAGEPVLNLGSSSAAARFLVGTMAGLGQGCIVDGDESLRARPMSWIVNPLRALGARIDYLGVEGRLPVRVHPSKLHGGRVRIEVGSAQASSAVLFAAFAAGIDVEIDQPVLARDHTARLMRHLGADITVKGGSYHIGAHREAKAYMHHRIPLDPSGLAYLFTAWFVQQRPEPLTIEGVCLNPTRTGFFDVMRTAGWLLDMRITGEEGGEPTGTVELRPGGSLRPVLVNDDFIFHAAIDEMPLLAAMSLFAEGDSRLLGAGELEFKETDRLQTTQAMLSDLGAAVERQGHGLHIRGGQALRAGQARSFGDHRIAMTAAVLGCALAGETTVVDGDCFITSFPGFVEAMNGLGFDVQF